MTYLRKTKKAKILVIGDIMIDNFIYGTTEEISFEAPVPIVKTVENERLLGGAGIIIENMASLGAKVFCIGILGNDENGFWLKNKIIKSGISEKGIIFDKSIKTLTRTRLLGNNHHIARFDERSISQNESMTKKILQKLRQLLPKVDLIIVADYSEGTINERIIETIKQLASTYKKKVLVSPVRNHLNYVDPSFIYRIKLQDALKILNLSFKKKYSTEQVCKKLSSLIKSNRIILTRGEFGLTAFENDVTSDILATQHKARDITSVGEILVSAFAVSYASGQSFEDACTIGNIAAGVVVEKMGSKHIDRKELDKAVKDYNEFAFEK